jgi:hypothetical protein
VNYWLLTLSLMNVLLMTVVLFSWLTKNKNRVEDQRLTKGLQLLQNKISILQDLSDKSDEQVRKWVHLIEQKSNEVQNQLIMADDKIVQIEGALSKALDVSKIFYEQVPHAEIAERQKTSQYVQAAKLAHQGFSADQIGQKIDLSMAEIEMIIKMNRDHLQFSEENLPAWINTDTSSDNERQSQEVAEFSAQLKKMNQSISSTAFEVESPDMTSMDNIKQQFTDSISMNSSQIPQTFLDEKKEAPAAVTENGKSIRPFEFRKITVAKN